MCVDVSSKLTEELLRLEGDELRAALNRCGVHSSTTGCGVVLLGGPSKIRTWHASAGCGCAGMYWRRNWTPEAEANRRLICLLLPGLCAQARASTLLQKVKVSRQLKREREARYREERGVQPRMAYHPSAKWYDD